MNALCTFAGLKKLEMPGKDAPFVGPFDVEMPLYDIETRGKSKHFSYLDNFTYPVDNSVQIIEVAPYSSCTFLHMAMVY